MNRFGDIYQRYAPDVFRFAYYLTGNRSDAEDITAETFVRVWSSGEDLRSQTVKGYLCTIARNLFLHEVRRRSRHIHLADNVPDRSPGQQEQAERIAELERVTQRLQQLPEIDRAALLMRTIENLPYEEIAVALGISTGAAKVKVHRARLILNRLRDSSKESFK